MWVSFSRDQDKPFIANIDWTKHNFVIDEKTGLALPRNIAEPVANTQSTVNATIEAKPETKEKDPNIVELDTENYGAPPENSGIAVYKNGMKSPNASLTEPQAWEDEKWSWFYNFAGAIQLAKSLGRTLPNIDQLVAAINANPDNFRQNVGYRFGGYGKFYGRGEFSDFWSSSEDGSNYAHYAYLEQGASSAGRNWDYRHRGLSVRFIVDKK